MHRKSRALRARRPARRRSGGRRQDRRQSCIEPDFDGYVFHHLLAGRNSFSEVFCNDNHIRFPPYNFHAPLEHVTYFGSFFVDWYAEDYYKLHKHIIFKGMPVGATLDRLVDDGVARVDFSDERSEVFQKFIRRTDHQGPFHVSLAQRTR
ncbi:MAG TPA: hypothetical protein VGK73_01475 [Polyangiaceae bacterium]